MVYVCDILKKSTCALFFWLHLSVVGEFVFNVIHQP